jgi:hypothetical protein
MKKDLIGLIKRSSRVKLLNFKNKYSKMKNKAKELDVDFIGGQGPITKDEEKQVSEFIKAQKLLRMCPNYHQESLSLN